MTLLNRLFFPDPSQTKWQKVILWWEIRRPLYNILLILFLSLTLLAVSVVPNNGFITVHTGPLLSVGIYLSILTYFITANILYSLGWIGQLLLWNKRRSWQTFTKNAFVLGILISLIVSVIPIGIALINWLVG